MNIGRLGRSVDGVFRRNVTATRRMTPSEIDGIKSLAKWHSLPLDSLLSQAIDSGLAAFEKEMQESLEVEAEYFERTGKRS